MEIQQATTQRQLALHLTHRPQVGVTDQFIEYLGSEPSPSEVAQELVLGYLGDFRARAAVISTIESDAELRLAGGFGLGEQVLDALGNCSLWDDLPAASAIRHRGTLVAVSGEHVAREFPAMRAMGLVDFSIIALPLLTTASTVGSITVCLQADGQSIAQAGGILETIASVYVLYLLTEDREVTVAKQAHHHGLKAEVSSTAFSTRQRTILGLLRDGMTYDQIAARIGFSNSTVRMELMRMYRAFGVTSRRDAVDAAVRRGFVEYPPTDESAHFS